MFAVVRKNETKMFNVWHPDYETAVAEATRLCRKERAEFIVLMTVASVTIDDIPVTISPLCDIDKRFIVQK